MSVYMLYISQIKLIKLMVTPVREAGTRDYGSYFLTDVFYQCITFKGLSENHSENTARFARHFESLEQWSSDNRQPALQ